MINTEKPETNSKKNKPPPTAAGGGTKNVRSYQKRTQKAGLNPSSSTASARSGNWLQAS
jgi:hypothetical protein